MRALIVGLVVALSPAAALVPVHAQVAVTGTFQFRDHVGPNTVGSIPGDRQQIGATGVLPAGAPTTATATQAGTVVELNFLPLTLLPNLYVRSVEFGTVPTGSWTITATRDDSSASAVTNPIPEPRLLPLLDHVRVFGTGLQPVIAWDVPDLTGMSVDLMRVRVHDATTGDQFAQFFVPFGPEPPRSVTVPEGILQYGRACVFRIQLEDFNVFPGGFIQNRSSTFSGVYTAATVVAGGGFTLVNDRAVFEGEVASRVVDDYSHPGYDVNPDPTQPDVLGDEAMSAVLGETRYTATQRPDVNVIVPGRLAYCAGCNGTFRLDFSATSVSEGGAVFGAGFDAFQLNNAMWPEHPYAFVTFGDGGTASVPLAGGFWSLISGRGIRSIHVGLPDGGAGDRLYVEIDNLTIGGSATVGVTIDIKPGTVPNDVNPGSGGKVPVAVLGTAALDAAGVDASTLTLTGAPVARTPKGSPMAALADVDGDGRADLVVHFEAAALLLGEDTTVAVLEGQTLDGRRIRGIDSVRLVR